MKFYKCHISKSIKDRNLKLLYIVHNTFYSWFTSPIPHITPYPPTFLLTNPPYRPTLNPPHFDFFAFSQKLHFFVHIHPDPPPPRLHNLCFRAKRRKNIYPSKPQFYYIKVGCKGSILHRHVSMMDSEFISLLQDVVRNWYARNPQIVETVEPPPPPPT